MKFSLALSALLAASQIAAAPAAMPDSLLPVAGVARDFVDHEVRADSDGGDNGEDTAVDTIDDDGDVDFDNAKVSALLEQLERIPAAVLDAGDAETAAWLGANLWANNYPPPPYLSDGVSDAQPQPQPETRALVQSPRLDLMPREFVLTQCVGAVTLAIAANAIPVIKLARLLRLFAKFGNIQRTLRLLRGIKTKAALKKVGGDALVQVASIILGVDGVAKKCFPGAKVSNLL